MAYRKIEQDRIDKGLCKNCGQPRTSAKVYCRSCIDKAKTFIDARRKKLREMGRCEDCGCDTQNDRVHCETCLAKQRAHRTKWKKLVPRGFCTRCKKNECLPQLIDAKLFMRLCQECYLRHAASVQLGSSQYWTTLLSTLEQQGWQCVYSGDEIILGVNDSVDHIMPKSKQPSLAKIPSNIQWVTRTINLTKGCLDHDEFLTLVRHINDRFPEH